MNGDILLTFNAVTTKQNKRIILKDGSFMELMNAAEKACCPIGFAKCSFPHFWTQDLGTKEKVYIWVLNGTIKTGDKAAFDADVTDNS